MAQGGRQLDQVTAERLLSTGEKVHWQHVRDYDRQERQVDSFGSKTSHLTVVGLGWAAVVGTSVAKSLLDPSKRHLLVSHRLIHARIVAQWCDALRPTPRSTRPHCRYPPRARESIAHPHRQRRHARTRMLDLTVRAHQGDDRCANRGGRWGENDGQCVR